MVPVEVVDEEVKDEDNFGRKEVDQHNQMFGFGDDSKDLEFGPRRRKMQQQTKTSH
jgi:hypothetical protein